MAWAGGFAVACLLFALGIWIMAGRAYKDISGAHNAVAVDISSTDQSLSAGCRGFQVGTAGDVKVDYVGGATGITIPACAAGVSHAHQISKIYKTGTTAVTIVAFY